MRTLFLPLLAAILSVSASAQNHALALEGGGSLVFPHDPIMNTGDSATIEGWVRADPAVIAGQLLFHRYQPSAEHKMISIYADGEIEYVYAGSPWSVPHAPPGSFPVDGHWHHVAFVRHPNATWQLFIDGHSILNAGPAAGFGQGCWLTCDVINATPPTVFETTPDAAGWSIDEWRMSSTDRYQADFVPQRYWVTDGATALLVGFDEGGGTTVHDSGPHQQVGALTGGFTWMDAPPHPSQQAFLEDDFNANALDATKWTAVTGGIPGASITQSNGVVTLANKGYLRTTREFDPLDTGEIRVRGRWKFTQTNPELGTLEVLTRTDSIPDPNHFYEASQGLEFNLWLGPAYPGVAVIHPRGTVVQTGTNTTTGMLHWTNDAWYEFEAIDAGSAASWRIWESNDPSNAVSVTAQVSMLHAPVNYVAIHGREYIGGPNVCDLDDVSISVPDCNDNHIADGVDIQHDPGLDLNGNWTMDACECIGTNYCTATANSTGSAAHISYAGSLSLGLDDLALVCTNLPPNTTGMFFFGSTSTSVAFGNGFRCVSGALTRFPASHVSPAGTAARSIDLHALPGTNTLVPGSTRCFQFWYRNPAGGGAGFNLSDGLRLQLCP